jgi:hypothetical protein
MEKSNASIGERIRQVRQSHGLPHRLNPEDILGHISLPGSSAGCFALVAYSDFMASTIQDNDLVFFRLGGIRSVNLALDGEFSMVYIG